MQKAPLHLDLYSGLPPFVSDERDREQWNRGPKVLGPSIAERIIAKGQSSNATPPEQKSESNPQS